MSCRQRTPPPYTKRVVVSEINLIICGISPVIWVPSIPYCAIRIIESLEV